MGGVPTKSSYINFSEKSILIKSPPDKDVYPPNSNLKDSDKRITDVLKSIEKVIDNSPPVYILKNGIVGMELGQGKKKEYQINGDSNFSQADTSLLKANTLQQTYVETNFVLFPFKKSYVSPVTVVDSNFLQFKIFFGASDVVSIKFYTDFEMKSTPAVTWSGQLPSEKWSILRIGVTTTWDTTTWDTTKNKMSTDCSINGVKMSNGNNPVTYVFNLGRAGPGQLYLGTDKTNDQFAGLIAYFGMDVSNPNILPEHWINLPYGTSISSAIMAKATTTTTTTSTGTYIGISLGIIAGLILLLWFIRRLIRWYKRRNGSGGVGFQNSSVQGSQQTYPNGTPQPLLPKGSPQYLFQQQSYPPLSDGQGFQQSHSYSNFTVPNLSNASQQNLNHSYR